ncbi:hypothetical protein LJB82_04430 [Desulfovibrio sp. OttesenSCG-928-M16]|nr:hypothetical protein [Desulfovibrio sp. OttesenSCG-928-M16]
MDRLAVLFDTNFAKAAAQAAEGLYTAQFRFCPVRRKYRIFQRIRPYGALLCFRPACGRFPAVAISIWFCLLRPR